MGRTRRVMPFLHRRQARWYFRFRLPASLRSVSARSELRVSLGTRDPRVARETAERALADVYFLKQLARHMSALEPQHVKKAIDLAFTAIVNELARTKEPWMRARATFPSEPSGTSLVTGPSGSFGGAAVCSELMYDLRLNPIRRAIDRNDHSLGAEAARKYLEQINAPVDEASPRFHELAIELLKLNAMYLEAQRARASGNFTREDEFIDYYHRRGYRLTVDTSAVATPKLSEVWPEYYREKTSALPKPQWSPKTASFQQATFREFLEIVGDLRLGEITRDTIVGYADVLQKLPKNRRKTHGDMPISELLKLDTPKERQASQRTLSEKLIRISSFIDWCRATKGAPSADPTERLTFRTDSRSYAPFTQSDLAALFNSRDYLSGTHRKSWQFWVPLIALYTGARQAEIAQLTVNDFGKEDGVPFLSITNFGEGQHVKTEAGIRKVPISTRLLSIGLMSYVGFLRDSGERSLFPDLLNADPRAISKWFNERYLESCGVQRRDASGARKVFHSFRHTAITKALSTGSATLAHCQQAFGHEKSLLGETATYMGAFPVGTLLAVIETLDFGLDHSRYADSWRKFLRRTRRER